MLNCYVSNQESFLMFENNNIWFQNQTYSFKTKHTVFKPKVQFSNRRSSSQTEGSVLKPEVQFSNQMFSFRFIPNITPRSIKNVGYLHSFLSNSTRLTFKTKFPILGESNKKATMTYSCDVFLPSTSPNNLFQKRPDKIMKAKR